MSFSCLLSEISFSFFSSSFTFVLAAVMLKCVLVSLYCGLLYLCVCAIKLPGAMNAASGYYRWYVLLLSLPLSAQDFNYGIKLPLYNLYLNFVFNSPANTAWKICAALAAIWFLIVLYRLEVQIITNIKLEAAIAALIEADADDAKDRAAAVFGLKPKRIKVVAADWISAAVTFGVFRKIILLPGDYKKRYSEHELYTLLLHEMAHIKNRDTIKLYVINLAKCVFFIPNGFVDKFTRDSEILCDNRVIRAADIDRNTYGDMLLKECRAEHSIIKGFAFSASFLSLQSRIDALYKFNPENRRMTVFTAAIFALLLTSFFSDCLTFDYLLRGEEASLLPGGSYGGIYEFSGTGAVRFDRVKLYDAMKYLAEQGDEISVVFFTVTDQNKYFYYLDESGERNGESFSGEISMKELLDAANGDIERYGVIDRFYLQRYLCYLALHWL